MSAGRPALMAEQPTRLSLAKVVLDQVAGADGVWGDIHKGWGDLKMRRVSNLSREQLIRLQDAGYGVRRVRTDGYVWAVSNG